jgi:hypothetical protein
LPEGYLHIFTEQCKEGCIPPSDSSHHSTLMVDEHRKKQVDALHAKTRYSQRLFAVNGRQRPVVHLTGDESDNSSHHGRLCFSTAHSYGLENTGIQSQKKSPCSTTAIFHRNRNHNKDPEKSLPVCSRGTWVCFFQSVKLPSDETIGAYMGIQGRWAPGLRTIEVEENEDNIICSSCNGFIWWPQFRSQRSHIP